ncbi:MAG: 50S ribosomal protein L1 [Candidatus Diapherotrites archaeon]|nr:50S ribosomal protein L1 [Candidatus Diapherotrites archaeon]
MKIETILNSLKEMREKTKKRNFEQTVELMINFKGLDFKKPENQVDVDVELPHPTGKGKSEILLFAHTPALAKQAEEIVTKVIMEDEIPNLNKKQISEILNDFDILLAEGKTMLAVGKYLGQQLAPRGKMPKPVSSIAEIKASAEAATKFVKVSNKKGKFMPVVHVVVGKESMDDRKIAENILAVYDAVVKSLPGKKYNIKSLYVKETMGPAIKIEEKEGKGD